MGFHKRYIDDEQVIEIYNGNGPNGVFEWYTKGVDALITSGELSQQLEDIIYSNQLTKLEKNLEIDRMVGIAAAKV